MGTFSNTFVKSFSSQENVKINDYIEIENKLNLLTDTSNTTYNGINPTIVEMENILNNINGEIV